MSDILDKLNGTHREIDYRETPAGRVRSLLIRRAYDAKIADVWDAITDPERLSRWFLPVAGDLREVARSSSRTTPAARSVAATRPILPALAPLIGREIRRVQPSGLAGEREVATWVAGETT
jgi:hypothetical protein